MVTCFVHDWQGRHSFLMKDVQSSDDGGVLGGLETGERGKEGDHCAKGQGGGKIYQVTSKLHPAISVTCI